VAKYRVTIEGRTYEVTVEEIDGAEQPARPRTEEPQAVGAKAGTAVPAPLGGVILSVKVKPGDAVERGQVLLTLEALKLENEITAPVSGRLVEIVSEGQTVEAGQPLAVIS
jgi:biotin carboxyl carrier protein